MFSVVSVIPVLIFILWLGAIVYVILLATRLVNAVEQLARVVTERLPARVPAEGE